MNCLCLSHCCSLSLSLSRSTQSNSCYGFGLLWGESRLKDDLGCVMIGGGEILLVHQLIPIYTLYVHSYLQWRRTKCKSHMEPCLLCWRFYLVFSKVRIFFIFLLDIQNPVVPTKTESGSDRWLIFFLKFLFFFSFLLYKKNRIFLLTPRGILQW